MPTMLLHPLVPSSATSARPAERSAPLARLRRWLARARVAGVGLGAAIAAAPAAAQIAGLPVVQSPFVSPGWAAAVNAGNSSEVDAVAGAASWTPRSARTQISGGVGVASRGKSGVAAGGRAYLPLKSFVGEAVTLGVFAGAGGDRVDAVTTVIAPVGATLGYRRALGATRALSLYGVPFYRYTRQRVRDADATASNVFRFSVGADAVIVRNIGLSLAFETGAKPASAQPGIRSSVTGVGVSYAF